MAGLSVSGFTPKTLEEIETESKADVRTNLSKPALNLSSTTNLGQIIGVLASQIREVWQGLQDVYAARDVRQADGDALTGLARLTGTIRRGATYSTVTATCDLDAGVYAIGSLVAHVVGDTTRRFSNTAEVTSVGGATAVAMTAEEPGPVQALTGTLTVIADPVAGFNSVTNAADAVEGLDAETDEELRVRQRVEVFRTGSSSAAAIAADVADVDSVSYVRVFENDTDATVGGIPPHSFETLVLGGVDADVAAAILGSKPAGIRAYGTTTETVTDSQGNDHSISFTRPTEVPVLLEVDVDVITSQYPGDTVLKAALVSWFDTNQKIGHDVLKARMESIVLGIDGTVDVKVRIGPSPGGPAVAANYVIVDRELATLDSGDITVTQTVVTAPP